MARVGQARFRRHRHHRAFPESMGRSAVSSEVGYRTWRDVAPQFVLTMCAAPQNWTMGIFVAEQVEFLRHKVGDGHVICGLSGGVDSSVTAAILQKAIGDQLHCVFVDNGLLRKGEREAVEQEFSDFDLTVVDASVEFLTALEALQIPKPGKPSVYSLRCSIEKPVDCPNLMEIYSGWRKVPIQMD